MVFLVGVILQVASAGLPLLVAGRVVAGLGVGGVSATLILYMSESAPRKVRGAIVSGYQFCITIGKSSLLYQVNRICLTVLCARSITRFRHRLRNPKP